MDKTQFMDFYKRIGSEVSVIVDTEEHQYKGKIAEIIEKDSCFLLEENRPYGAIFAIKWDEIARIEPDVNDVPKEYIEGVQK